MDATSTPKFESFGIASSAMLVELSISCWTGRILDKKVSEEVDLTKNTKVKGGNYHKHLLAGCRSLDAVVKYAANVRLWNNRQTLPWSDAGSRIVTMAQFMNGYKAQLDEHKSNYDKLAEAFIAEYPTLVSAMAFQLGDLFNRDDYPMQEEIESKFRFNYMFSPVPTAGDFRIDINEQAKEELAQQYEGFFQNRVNTAMREAWDRLHDCLTHLSDRLASTDEGKRKAFHDTLITNAAELVGLLENLNITNDPKLSEARQELAAAILNKNPEMLREDDYARDRVKEKVDAILDKFDW